MNLNVSLAGCQCPWRFRDFTLLDAWLADRPWIDRGGVKVVRVSSARVGVGIAQAIRRNILAHDEGTSDVRIHLLDPSWTELSQYTVITRVLGLSPDLPRRELLRQASRVLLHRPTVLLFEGPHVSDPCARGDSPEPQEGRARASRSLLEEWTHFLDEVGRIEGAVVTILAFDTPTRPRASSFYDLTVGMPAEGVLRESSASESVLWHAYVHARLAWEVAGDLDRAQCWDEEGFASIPIGSDEALESLLNRCAEKTHADLHPALKELLTQYLAQLVRPSQHDVLDKRSAAAELLSRGVLWKPAGESLARPVPWMARALLLHQEAEDARFLLRGCLVCAPLAKELLSRCFDLEARERIICWAERGDTVLPSNIQDRFRTFMEGDPRSEYLFYPVGCPAAPADVWPFATYGELLYLLKPARQHDQHQIDLRNLRNALVHGHYVSWHAVTMLRRIEAAANR